MPNKSPSATSRFQRILTRNKVAIFLLALSPIVLLLLLLSLNGRANQSQPQQNPTDEAAILAAYNAAIYDAAVYKFSNLRPLKPLTFDQATKTVKVVALTKYPYHLGATVIPKRPKDPEDVWVWVTQVPEVQETCRGFSGDLEVRLRQLLGLHPGSTFDNFVVMTAKEGDIFRPTANPDPTTTLPCSYPPTVNCGETFPEPVSDQHLRWFANKMLSSYVISESSQIPVGYPWTRLGYTYDWKPGANKYGASEYVIKPGSNVTVTAIFPYKKYCSPQE